MTLATIAVVCRGRRVLPAGVATVESRAATTNAAVLDIRSRRADDRSDRCFRTEKERPTLYSWRYRALCLALAVGAALALCCGVADASLVKLSVGQMGRLSRTVVIGRVVSSSSRWVLPVAGARGLAPPTMPHAALRQAT